MGNSSLLHANQKGGFRIDGDHWYYVGPQGAGAQVLVHRTAWEVRVHDTKRKLLKSFERVYSPGRTERYDLEAMLRGNMRKLFFSNAGIEWCLEHASGRSLCFVDELFRLEAERRDSSRRANMVRQAGFPSLKSIDDFDLSLVKMPSSLTMESMLALEFIEDKHSLVMYGACGTGKTALSICLGMLACEKGYKVRFFTLLKVKQFFLG